MDLAKIREILKLVAESGVAEVEIEEDDFKLVVRLNAPNVSIQPPAQAPYPYPQQPPFYPPPAFAPPAYVPPPPPVQHDISMPQAAPPVQQQAPLVSQPVAPAANPASASDADTIKAPIVGTFYRSSSPEAEPFVKVGDKIQVGDVLCIIEAMKLMNEIESEVSGTIKEVLIENAQPVEYDQPLFVIESA